MNAHDLHKKYSAAELTAMQRAIRDDPKNANPQLGSIFKYTPGAHRKLAAIAHAIRWYVMDSESAEKQAEETAVSDAIAKLNWGIALDLLADDEISEALQEFRGAADADPTFAVSLIVSRLVAHAEASSTGGHQ